MIIGNLQSYQIFVENLSLKTKKGIGLKSIIRKIYQEGYLKNTFLFTLERKNTCYNEYKFYDIIEKKIRFLFFFSPCKQLINEGLTFTHRKVGNYNGKTLNKISTWKKIAYNLRAHSRDINSTTNYMRSPVNLILDIFIMDTL